MGNDAAQYKVGRYIDTTNTAGSNIVGTTGLLTVGYLNIK
jgi:hypothetical protein